MTDVSALRAEVLQHPLEFYGTLPITWEYDCRICMQLTRRYREYRIHTGEPVICLPDWAYAHAWHSADDQSLYVDYLVELRTRGISF